MKIGVGSDQNGFDMKEAVREQLLQLGHEVIDFGCGECQQIDYPDVAFEVAKRISKEEIDRGILICGTGIGVAIAANKYPGIRAALCHDIYSAERAQLSNNAQIMTMGAQIIGIELAKKLVEKYMSCTFVDGRSTSKIEKITQKENQLYGLEHMN